MLEYGLVINNRTEFTITPGEVAFSALVLTVGQENCIDPDKFCLSISKHIPVVPLATSQMPLDSLLLPVPKV